MLVGGRDLTTIAKAVTERRHYTALRNMIGVYTAPVQMFGRYLSTRGNYPYTAQVRTPLGIVDFTLYSSDDVRTANEIFCRLDYKADAEDRVVVDFGSNIGISASYFLSRGPGIYAYLYEPLPSNVVRLRSNLTRFVDRYTLEQVAVGPKDGEVQFGWEETGRYGGVDADWENSITVTCRNSRRLLEDIVASHGVIDILKVDIETLEEAVIADIPPALARKIRKIYVEYRFADNPLAATHTHRQYGGVAQFFLR
ncbi:MAG: FkbM family methyltransferase [Mycobacterium sp.]|uniref:FkbM family methyltransferase n=1 Tax=Mycobacterium sp. TaxID=1785 RepID=UPI001ECF19F6|nr:FkbM family methyltransferase [Mycobacterium sp.]MBW0015934.1 FkbM family methyltransferase [Mycobacterium sp.]